MPRKQINYRALVREQQQKLSEVEYVHLSMSVIDIFDQLTTSFIAMLPDLKYDLKTRNHMIRRTMTIAVRTYYYIFC